MLNATHIFPIKLRGNTLPVAWVKLSVGLGEYEVVAVSGSLRAVVEVSEGVTVAVVTVRGVEVVTDKLIVVGKVEIVVVRGGKRVETSAFQENQDQVKHSILMLAPTSSEGATIFPPMMITT